MHKIIANENQYITQTQIYIYICVYILSYSVSNPTLIALFTHDSFAQHNNRWLWTTLAHPLIPIHASSALQLQPHEIIPSGVYQGHRISKDTLINNHSFHLTTLQCLLNI